VSIVDKNGNSVRLDSSGNNLTIDVQGNVTVKSQGNLTLEAQGEVQIKGVRRHRRCRRGQRDGEGGR